LYLQKVSGTLTLSVGQAVEVKRLAVHLIGEVSVAFIKKLATKDKYGMLLVLH